MDKKGNRSVQPSSKGQTSDSKKSQDVSSKPLPRSGRRREPTSGSLSAKGEPSRKPPPQRTNKMFDIKRPKPRGTCNAGLSLGRTETARLEDEFDAELGSVFLPGSKKQSLNHVIQFFYSTPTSEARYQSERGFGQKKSNRLILTRKHKYNKEHFLQANCQFVVNASGDYKRYANDPDALVDWNLVEQVNVQVPDYPSCPICLYPPVAAKITRCGHIYCWSCLLHYLSFSEKTWSKCPICPEAVHRSDLKSVVSKHYKTLNVGDVITFKLMKREKGSLVTYPASATVRDNEVFKFSEAEKDDVYSKLLIANTAEILSIIEREDNELEEQLLENGDCPENRFIEEAKTLLKERRDAVLNNCTLEVGVKKGFENLETGGFAECLDVADTAQADNLDMSTASSQQSKFYFFYQASDGQHIYLHAINARMLEHHYFSLEKSPPTITGKILEKEGGSMTEDLRKRLRYLQHLPVTCQFEVAEIVLKRPIVSKETIQYFSDQLDVRKKRRQRLAREEKKREKKIADEENKLMGKHAPVRNLHLESESQFPYFEARERTESECTQPSENSLPETPSNSLNFENEHSGPSFAKMLASVKKADTNKWPVLKSTTSAPPTTLINVTGQKINSSCFNSSRSNRSDSEPETEGFEPIPPNSSLGDVILQAIQKAEGDTLTDSGVAHTGKKKKVKNRQKVLFTTTLAYTGNK